MKIVSNLLGAGVCYFFLFFFYIFFSLYQHVFVIWFLSMKLEMFLLDTMKGRHYCFPYISPHSLHYHGT